MAFRHARNDSAGTAAIEFAMLAPVLTTLILGTIELTNLIRVQSKLHYAAGQLAELIAGQTSVTEGSSGGSGGSLGDMCTAVAYDLLPYNAGSLSGYIGSTSVWNGGAQYGQDWASDKSCPASNPIGSAAETIILTNIADSPRSLFTTDGTPASSGGSLAAGSTAISVQLTYTYSNVLTYMLGPTLTFKAVGVARARTNATITCTYPSGSVTASCPSVY